VAAAGGTKKAGEKVKEASLDEMDRAEAGVLDGNYGTQIRLSS